VRNEASLLVARPPQAAAPKTASKAHRHKLASFVMTSALEDV
jgi:hypothetical protein